MIELKMKFVLGNLCVDIEIWDKNKNLFKETEAIFDTGAYLTHIDIHAFKRLGYNLDKAEKRSINSVGSRGM